MQHVDKTATATVSDNYFSEKKLGTYCAKIYYFSVRYVKYFVFLPEKKLLRFFIQFYILLLMMVKEMDCYARIKFFFKLLDGHKKYF